MENLEVASSNAECTVIPSILKAATPVGAVSRTVTLSGCTCPESRKSFTVSLWIRDNDVALPNTTRTTEKDSIRLDGLTSLHGNNGILTPSSVKGDYLLLFAVQSSH